MTLDEAEKVETAARSRERAAVWNFAEVHARYLLDMRNGMSREMIRLWVDSRYPVSIKEMKKEPDYRAEIVVHDSWVKMLETRVHYLEKRVDILDGPIR